MPKNRYSDRFARYALIFAAICIFLLPQALFASSEAEPAEGQTQAEDSGLPNLEYFRGRVIQVETVSFLQDKTLGYDETKQISQIEIIQGPFKGRVYTDIVNYVRASDPQQIYLELGDIVVVSVELTPSGDNIKSMYISDYYRLGKLSFLLAIVAACLAACCWMAGLRAIVALACFTGLAAFAFSPLMLRGLSPMILCLPIVLLIAAIFVFGEFGLNARGICAFASFLVSVAFAGLCGFISEKTANLTGLGESELSMLYYLRDHQALNYSGLVAASAMIISAVSICDTAIYAINEVYNYHLLNPYIRKRELFYRGLTLSQTKVARSAANLFIILSAAMLPIWLLYTGYNTPFMQMANMDSIAIQFFRAASGMAGVIVCLPVSTFIYTQFVARESVY